MERRGFLKLFGLGVAGIALEQAIPFNRVWSFPKEIIVAQCIQKSEVEMMRKYFGREQIPWVKEYLNAVHLGDSVYLIGDRWSTPAFPPELPPSSS